MALPVLVCLIAIYPLVTVWQDYSARARAGRTNDEVIALTDNLRRWQASYSRSTVLVHERIGGQYERGPQYTLAALLDYLLTMEDVPHRTERVTSASIEKSLDKTPGPILAVVPAGSAAELRGAFALQMLASERVTIRWEQKKAPRVEVLLLSRLPSETSLAPAFPGSGDSASLQQH